MAYRNSHTQFNVKDFGALGDGSTDDTAAIQATINAASGNGTILIPTGTYYLNSGTASALTLPRSATGLKIFGVGDSSVLKLSTNTPRAFDFNKVADYDLFQNIELGSFAVDCNSISSTNANHVVVGTRRGSSGAQTRLNFDNLYFHDITFINVPTPASGSGIVRIGIYLSVQQVSGSEGTQNYGKNIRVERVRGFGGTGGVYVDGGTNATFPDVNSNVMLDNITISDCYHTTNVVPSGFNAQANFLIGGSVYGGRCTIKDCVGELSGDVAIEVDSMTEAIVKDCELHDAGFYFTNYHAPLYPAEQRIVMRGCAVRLVNNSARSAYNITPYNFHRDSTANIDLGAIEMYECSVYRSLAAVPIGVRTVWITGPCSRITINDYTAIVDNINYTDTAGSDLFGIYMSNASGTGSVNIPISIRNLRLSFKGARSGSGVLTVRGIGFIGNTKGAPFNLDGCWLDFGLTGMSAASVRGIDFGFSGSSSAIGGRLSRIHINNLTDDTGAAAIRFGASGTGTTISGRVDIENSDFSALLSGQVESLFSTSNALRPLVYFAKNRWRVYPIVPRTTTGNYTIQYPFDESILADATSGAITVTLLDATSVPQGQQYTIKRTNTNTNTVTINTTSSQTIDGSLSYILNNYGEAITVISDGTNWRMI